MNLDELETLSEDEMGKVIDRIYAIKEARRSTFNREADVKADALLKKLTLEQREALRPEIITVRLPTTLRVSLSNALRYQATRWNVVLGVGMWIDSLERERDKLREDLHAGRHNGTLDAHARIEAIDVLNKLIANNGASKHVVDRLLARLEHNA